MCQALFNSSEQLVLKVWSLDLRLQRHLRMCQKSKFSGPTSDKLSQKLRGLWPSSLCFSKSSVILMCAQV